MTTGLQYDDMTTGRHSSLPAHRPTQYRNRKPAVTSPAHRFTRRLLLPTAALLIAPLACTDFAFRSLTAPLGTGNPGSRGNISLTIFNRTPYRAIFTLGMYNIYDQDSEPLVFQFADGTQNSTILNANVTIGPQNFSCDRTLGIGSPQLLQAFRNSRPDQIHEAAMIEGVGFSSAPIDDPLGVLPTEGTAQGINIFLGAEFPCEAELWIFLEQDDAAPGGFRVAYEVVTPP